MKNAFALVFIIFFGFHVRAEITIKGDAAKILYNILPESFNFLIPVFGLMPPQLPMMDTRSIDEDFKCVKDTTSYYCFISNYDTQEDMSYSLSKKNTQFFYTILNKRNMDSLVLTDHSEIVCRKDLPNYQCVLVYY